MISNEHEALFRRWMADHQGLLFKVVRSHEANPEDQQDLLQEIVLQMWRSIPSWMGRCRETTWIYRVALNTAYGWRRSEKRRRERNERVAAFAVAVDADVSSGEAMLHRSDLEHLYGAIRQLAQSDASLIIMHLDGLSAREIAEVLGISENNVAVKLSRARKQLAQLMRRERL